jgi:hypothetical protein
MSVTRLAVACGVLAFAGLCYLAALGSRPATEVLVTGIALVVLVGGGNWINGRGQTARSGAHPPSSTMAGDPRSEVPSPPVPDGPQEPSTSSGAP